MTWWVWVLLGLGLLAGEMLTPGGFFVLFFGVAALIVGLLVAMDLGGPAWTQWLVFSSLAIASLLTFRRRLKEAFSGSRDRSADVEDLIGEVAVLSGDLAPGAVGKAELRGTVWSVRSSGARALTRDQRCRVERVEGLTLWVRAE